MKDKFFIIKEYYIELELKEDKFEDFNYVLEKDCVSKVVVEELVRGFVDVLLFIENIVVGLFFFVGWCVFCYEFVLLIRDFYEEL